MLIQCTKALLDKLGLSPDELKPAQGHENMPEALLAWHAGLVNIDRRKTVVLMNNASRYPVVIYRPKPQDFSRMRELIHKAIVEALRMEGISEAVIDRYMADAGEIQFSKTANKSLVAKLNKAVKDVYWVGEYLDSSTPIQRYFSIQAGRMPQNLPYDEFYYPINELLKYLEDRYADVTGGVRQPVIDVEAYQLKIELEIEGFDIWRRVVVPSTFSFEHLHNVIQIVFDWHNSHLHMFEVHSKRARRPMFILMDDDPDTLEWADTGEHDILLERFTALKDIFPHHENVMYEYDFGDSWGHRIVLEKVGRSNAFAATYLAGKGDRPPEDVGGESGYIEFVEIMADKRHPEHAMTKTWAQFQCAREFSPEQINHRLRHALNTEGYSPNCV